MKYDKKGEFREGMAWVKKGNKYGFIDENEKLVIPFQFFDVDDFSEGLAPVMVKLWQGDYKYGYIDKKGVMVISPKYEKAFKFSNGMANCTQYIWLVFYDFYIDKTGRKICLFEEKKPKNAENEIHQLPVIKTEEDAVKAARLGGEAALYYVPDELKTEKVCMEAVKNCGENFRFVPEKIRTAELCLEAIKNSSEYMFFEELPGKFQNKDTLLEAMKHGYPIIRAEGFSNIPKTRLMYYEAIKFDVLNMEGIGDSFELKRKLKNPLDILTYEMFLEGVKQFGVHISLLPYEYFTPEICLEAVKPDTVRHKIYNDLINKGSAINWIPEEFITEEICLLAVRQNGFNLQYVPPKFRTKELCRLALYNELCGFEFIPEEFLTEEWCYIGAKAKNHFITIDILKEIPEKFRTERVCIECGKK